MARKKDENSNVADIEDRFLSLRGRFDEFREEMEGERERISDYVSDIRRELERIKKHVTTINNLKDYCEKSVKQIDEEKVKILEVYSAIGMTRLFKE